jgi:tRNA threonylcarbamoyladenosine biosynthesis protein TsaB
LNPLILYIETSGSICSVALAEGEYIMGIKESTEINSHAAKVAVFVNELLKENKIKANQLQAIALSIGPGSYTGLRIGTSLAKGICYAMQIPLIAVSTLQVMSNGMIEKHKQKDLLYCPMIDARRMEVYTALYNYHLEMVEEEKAIILEQELYAEYSREKIIFFGNGAEKYLQIDAKAKILNTFFISASHLIKPALTLYEHKKFIDIAYFEPNYIKPFYSTKPS